MKQRKQQQSKGTVLLEQVKRKQQQIHNDHLDKLIKKKQKKTAFDKVNFNG